MIRLERNEVEAHDEVWSPFAQPQKYPYIDFDVVDLPFTQTEPAAHMTVHIEVTHHHLQATRTNYTFLDFLGNIAALFTALYKGLQLVGGKGFGLETMHANYIAN